MSKFSKWLVLREGDSDAIMMPATQAITMRLTSGVPSMVGPALQQLSRLDDNTRQEILNSIRKYPIYNQVMNYLMQKRGIQPAMTGRVV